MADKELKDLIDENANSSPFSLPDCFKWSKKYYENVLQNGNIIDGENDQERKYLEACNRVFTTSGASDAAASGKARGLFHFLIKLSLTGNNLSLALEIIRYMSENNILSGPDFTPFLTWKYSGQNNVLSIHMVNFLFQKVFKLPQEIIGDYDKFFNTKTLAGLPDFQPLVDPFFFTCFIQFHKKNHYQPGNYPKQGYKKSCELFLRIYKSLRLHEQFLDFSVINSVAGVCHSLLKHRKFAESIGVMASVEMLDQDWKRITENGRAKDKVKMGNKALSMIKKCME